MNIWFTSRRIIVLIILIITLILVTILSFQSELNIHDIPTDLTTPIMVNSEPSPGKRVKQVPPEYQNTDVYHALYLPTDWQEGQSYPVIVEYAGNGGYSNQYGDVCTGKVEDCNLGYGISSGKDMIWVCMPYISADHQHNQSQWWGDADATAEYCYTNVLRICDEYGGDRSKLIITGFSRGAIACNFIGLRNDQIAGLWKAFIIHSHYDGVYDWQYSGSGKLSAMQRLQRLNGRPQWISHEISIDDTKAYLQSTGINAPFKFIPVLYSNHTDTWVLRDIPERQILRDWLEEVLNQK